MTKIESDTEKKINFQDICASYRGLHPHFELGKLLVFQNIELN